MNSKVISRRLIGILKIIVFKKRIKLVMSQMTATKEIIKIMMLNFGIWIKIIMTMLSFKDKLYGKK